MGVSSETCFICDSVKQPATIQATQSHVGDFVTVDVSGVRYKILREKILQYPSSLLFRLLHYSQGGGYGKSNNTFLPEGVVYLAPNTYFVQRSPELFDVVVQCYANGKFHAKRSYCKTAVAEELAYWGMNFVQSCDSCFDECNKLMAKTDTNEYKYHENFIRTIMASNADAVSQASAFSKRALTFDILSMTFIVISTINLIISTLPGLRFCPDSIKNVTDSFSNKTSNENTDVVLKEEDDLPFLTNCVGLKVFGYIELACICWFTIELVIRFCMSQSVRSFITSPMHIIDLLAIIPYYIELTLWAVDTNRTGIRKARTMLLLLRMLRTVRIFRILKIARYSDDLMILGATLRAAKKELFMLFLFMFIGLIIFSSVVFQLEKDELDSGFTSIPASCWWGIATLSTVGYGDVTPKTPLGKLVATLACVCGVLVMAFPVSILVEHFTNAYKERSSANERKNSRKISSLSRRKTPKIPVYKISPAYVEHTKI